MNKLKLWQKRYILSVKILLSVVFAGTVGFIFYHVPYDSLFLYPLYISVAFYILWLYAMEDAKWYMMEEWQDWVDNKLCSKEYADALLQHSSYPQQLDYDTFLTEKFSNNPILKELYR